MLFAGPSCREGVIDLDGLKRYIGEYAKYFALSPYDLEAMPYVLYFWHTMCNYAPSEMMSIPESYQAVAELIQKMLKWLHGHAEELANALI